MVLKNSRPFLIILISLILQLMTWRSQAAPQCYNPKKVRGLSTQDLNKVAYLCNSTTSTSYCTEKKPDQLCFKVSTEDDIKAWVKKDDQNPVFKKLKKDNGHRSLLLASYTDRVKFKKPLRLEKTAKIRTGKYSGISLGKNSLFPTCFEEMLFTAQQLQTELSQFNFEIDGRIQSCKALRDAAHLIITNKDKIKKNLNRIHSPLHTIYLTTVTKFNESDLGKMGLYVNVGRKNEIRNRLIDFKIKSNQIKYESSRLVKK